MFLRYTFSFQEIAEIYEKEDKIAECMEFYENAAELYEGEEATSQGNQCKLKVAQFAAILEQ
jgi:alpha-soluble NSF attachment protein